MLRQCIVQFRTAHIDAGDAQEDMAQPQTLRQTIRAAAAKETDDDILLQYEQELGVLSLPRFVHSRF